MTKKVLPYTVPSTGETINISPVSVSLILMDLKRNKPKPKPPLQKVDFGNGEVRMEYNPAHPGYASQVAAWDEEMQEKALEVALRLMVRPMRLTDEQQALVNDVRDELGDVIELPKSDKMVWFKYGGLTDSDFMHFTEWVGKLADPTPEGIAGRQDGFRRNVPG